MTETITLELYLVRHGETDSNRRAIIQGHIDTPLNDLGRAQCRALGQHFAQTGVRFDLVQSSDLSRAYETAELVLEQLDSAQPAPGIEKDKRLRERYLGSLQGTTYHSGAKGEDVEPLEPYLRRLLSWYDDLLASTTSNRTILATTHGGPIKQLVPALTRYRDCAFAKGVSAATSRVYNCSVTHVNLTKRDGFWTGRIERYADVSFFPQPEEASAPGDAELAEHARGS